ncbi:MAG: response regulator [Candidatus Moranbacteria bacterium]|nr:response regulator [Candidatus Moranbacteria bacterium]
MPKILIVEDEPILNKALTEFLTEAGFEILNAFNGDEAVKIAQTKKVDLILLDIVLPKKDGYEVLDELKKDPRIAKTPIVLLTNLESMENIEKAFDRGATTYLVKSNYKLEEIVGKIKEVLENAK